MTAVIYVLLAAALVGALSLLLGNALLRAVRLRLARTEAMFLSFVTGAGLLAGIVFAMASAGLARKGAFYIASAILLLAGLWRRGFLWPRREERVSRVFLALYAIFAFVPLSIAIAPEASLDGSSHYLADGARRSSGGVEMLFRFAFAIGKHSAAAMVELLFYFALPWGMLAYAQRIGNPRAGVLASLLFFLSPIAQRTGTIAAPDAAIACIAFALFYMIGIAPAGHQRRLWAPAAVLFTFLAWTMTPWLIREFGKPILHLNGWYGRLPLDLAVHGERLDGLLGPVFLLTPLSLLALRSSPGRRLVAWGCVLAAPCLGAMETRAVIAALPFFSLALALVLTEIRLAVPATLAAHAIFSWPAFLPLYTGERAWILRKSEWAAALRIESQDSYLTRALPGYHLARVLDTTLPRGARIFAMHAFPSTYSREMAEGETGASRPYREALLSAIIPERLPVRLHELRFPEQPLRTIRLTPEPFDGRHRWGIYEIHLFQGETEITPDNTWRATALTNPEAAALAFDGNPATRWTSGRTSAGRMQFTLNLPTPRAMDRIVLQCGPDQARPVRLEGVNSVEATSRDLEAPPEGLRANAIAFLKQAGFGWLIVSTTEARFTDFIDRAAGWGLDTIAFEDGYAAFRLK